MKEKMYMNTAQPASIWNKTTDCWAWSIYLVELTSELGVSLIAGPLKAGVVIVIGTVSIEVIVWVVETVEVMTLVILTGFDIVELRTGTAVDTLELLSSAPGRVTVCTTVMFRTEDHQGANVPDPPVMVGLDSMDDTHRVLKLPVMIVGPDTGALTGGGMLPEFNGGSSGTVVVDIMVVDVIDTVPMGTSKAEISLTKRPTGGVLVACGRGPLIGVG